MPSVAVAKGSGTKRRYSYHDVLELKVIKQLLKHPLTDIGLAQFVADAKKIPTAS